MVQGITEFLPISSSGHLILVPVALGLPDQSLILDVAVHVGTLLAVMLYLWRDMVAMVASIGISRTLKGKRDPGGRLFWFLVIGTIPVVIAGFAVNKYYPEGFRSLLVLGWTTFGFGLLLMVADKTGMTLRRIEHLRFGDVLIIGIAQTLALVPGTSRSGICMTAARIIGMERIEAARFSMLLGIPAILGAGTLKGYDLWKAGDAALSTDAVLSAGMACIAALVAITVMMLWLRHATFTPFVVYRVVLGGSLLAVAYGWVG